jgi:hypothetical protein
VEAVEMSADVIYLGDEKFERQVQRLHALGPRVLCACLCKLGAQHLLRQPIEAIVARYAAIDPEALAAAGGDRPLVSTQEAVKYIRAARRLEP